jgi:glucokinase-like ROK family protein
VQKATRKQTKAHNSRLVLKTIYDRGQISRADIARATRLTRTTVSDLVAGLMDQGLVEEVGHGPSAGGKPPILLSVIEDARHVIGIDLASHEFRGAVINLRGHIRHRISVPLQHQDGAAALSLVCGLVDGLIGATDSPLVGIGIGTPGLMDPIHGVVRRAVNLDWQDLPLRDLLQARYDLPVYVANDCQVAALAEYTFGTHNGAQNLVVIKIEHGIGAGIVLHGQPFYGDTLGAGEIGHVTVIENGQVCRCGNVGCLETVANVPAILQQARAIAQNDPQSLLRQFAANPEEITLDTVCQALEAGDPAVQQEISEIGHYLGLAIANLVGVLSVRRVLIAGSVTQLGQALLDSILRELVQRALALVAEETEVGMSAMGPDIVILGASALVLTNELSLFGPPASESAYPFGGGMTHEAQP